MTSTAILELFTYFFSSQVFELYGSSRASLEVEFFSEVGSGLGPTLEFYALVSKEFARKGLALWREGDASESEFVYNTSGLFPRPSEDNCDEVGAKRLKVFRVLGQFIAKGECFVIRFVLSSDTNSRLPASYDGFSYHRCSF